jgi:hypothetical protein
VVRVFRGLFFYLLTRERHNEDGSSVVAKAMTDRAGGTPTTSAFIPYYGGQALFGFAPFVRIGVIRV